MTWLILLGCAVGALFLTVACSCALAALRPRPRNQFSTGHLALEQRLKAVQLPRLLS